MNRHNPSFAVNYGTSRYEDVTPDHSALVGTRGRVAHCAACGRERELGRYGICDACQRTQHAEEQRRMELDAPMGDHKRTPITLDTARS